jgi:hypothetical protein
LAREPCPAFALLIDAGRRSLSRAVSTRPPAASERDWLALPDAAQRHGMSAWVDAATAAWPATPVEIDERVSRTSRTQRLRALQGLAQLTSLVRLLRAAGIESVALKGPAFACWLYGDAGMRRFADLDLLIHPSDRVRALESLRAAGYSLPGGITMAAARTVYAGVGAWPLGHAREVGVDLHWTAQAARFGSALDTGAVLRDSTAVAIGGEEIRIPSATHTATLALLHAAKHTWSSLELVLAIAHLLRREDVDWSRVHQLSAGAGAWNGSAAGLALAVELFEVELPPELRRRVDSAAVRPLVGAALAFLAMPGVEDASRRREFSAHCAALDSARHRLAYAAWRVLAPTPLEAAWCRLPDPLVGLYFPARIVRLAGSAVLAGARATARAGS